jgi:hypothetical protein
MKMVDNRVPGHEECRKDRLARAYESLEGLSCGDAFGECFFGPKEEPFR